MKRILKVDGSIVEILTISIQISQFCVLYSSLLDVKREHLTDILNYRFLIINISKPFRILVEKDRLSCIAFAR